MLGYRKHVWVAVVCLAACAAVTYGLRNSPGFAATVDQPGLAHYFGYEFLVQQPLRFLAAEGPLLALLVGALALTAQFLVYTRNLTLRPKGGDSLAALVTGGGLLAGVPVAMMLGWYLVALVLTLVVGALIVAVAALMFYIVMSALWNA